MAYALSDDDVRAIAQQEGVDPDQLLAISQKENSPDNAVSVKGARGRFQLLPTTFTSVNPTGNIDDPRDNAIASARYLKQGLSATGGDFNKAAMYYYAGPDYQKKIDAAPGKKYGGLSIEDYGQQAASKLPSGMPDGTAMVQAQLDANGSQPTAILGNAPSLIPSRSAFGIDLGDIDAQIAKVSLAGQQALEKAGIASDSLSTTLQKNITDQMSTMESNGQLEAVGMMDQYRQKMQRAAEINADLSRRGINLSDIDSVIAQAATDNKDDYETSMALRSQIDSKRNINLLDDPLGWIGARLSLPSEIAQHNSVIQRMEARKSYVDEAAATASAVQQANAAKFVPVSLEGASAAAQVLRNKAHLEALQTQDKLLKQDYETQVRTIGLISSQMALLQQTEARAETLKQKRSADEVKAAEQQRVQLDNMAVNVAGKTLGLDIADRKTLERMPKDVKEAVEYIVGNGGGIGKEPLEAVSVLKRGNPQQMPPTVKMQMDILLDAQRQAVATMQRDPLLKGQELTREKQSQYINNEMSKVLDRAAADPNYKGIKTNPYHLPPIEAMRELPELQSNPMVGIVQNFKKLQPNTELTDSLTYNLALAEVGEGKQFKDITEAARAVSSYYQRGIKLNNDKMRFEGYGMKKQEDYKVDGTDYSSYADVMKKYISATRAKASGDFMTEPGLFGQGA